MRSCCKPNNCSLQRSGDLWGKLAEAANSSIQFQWCLEGNSCGGKGINNLQTKQLLIRCVTISQCHHSGRQMQMHEAWKKTKPHAQLSPPYQPLGPTVGLGWLSTGTSGNAPFWCSSGFTRPIRAAHRGAQFVFLPLPLQELEEDIATFIPRLELQQQPPVL